MIPTQRNYQIATDKYLLHVPFFFIKKANFYHCYLVVFAFFFFIVEKIVCIFSSQVAKGPYWDLIFTIQTTWIFVGYCDYLGLQILSLKEVFYVWKNMNLFWSNIKLNFSDKASVLQYSNFVLSRYHQSIFFRLICNKVYNEKLKEMICTTSRRGP